MKNFIQDGEVLTLVAPYDVASGDGVLVGSIFGVAAVSASLGEPVQVKRCGVVRLVKVSAQAWVQGTRVFWDNANRQCTTAEEGNALIGAAAAPVADPSAAGDVLLDGVIR